MFNHHSIIPWGSFRGRQEEKWGSFRGQFGHHFRVGDHFGVGIISGAVQIFSEGYSRAKLFIDYFSWPCELFKNAHACALRDCLGVSRSFVSDTSPKCIDREGLKWRRTGTRQVHTHITPVMNEQTLFIVLIWSLQLVSLDVRRQNIIFKLLSLNIRGIRSFGRRKSIFNWLLKSSADIRFLQDTHSPPEVGCIIYTNEKLNLIGAVESPNCTFCQEEAETVEHSLFSCRISSDFWKHVLSWLRDNNVHVEKINESMWYLENLIL